MLVFTRKVEAHTLILLRRVHFPARTYILLFLQALALLEGDYKLNVTKVDVLEGDDSSKKIKQMKTFSGRDTVPQVCESFQTLRTNPRAAYRTWIEMAC